MFLRVKRIHIQVYDDLMGRTNVVGDDRLVAEVMKLYGLKTKKDAIHFALDIVANRDERHDAVLKLEGKGWSGDLAEMRGWKRSE